MGKVLKFGKNRKNYTLPVAGKDKPVKEGVYSSEDERKAEGLILSLKSSFTQEQIDEIERELEGEVEDE